MVRTVTDGLDQEDTDQEEITRREFLAAMTGLAAATFGGMYLHDKSKEFFPFPGEITDVKGKQTWGIDNQTQVTYIEREKFSILPFTYPTQA